MSEDLVALRPDASIEQHLAIVSEPAAQDVVILITAARSGPLRSRFGDEIAMPAQQGLGLNEEAPEAFWGSSRVNTASSTRSETGSAGRCAWRRRTATSCRGMTTSMARSVSP